MSGFAVLLFSLAVLLPCAYANASQDPLEASNNVRNTDHVYPSVELIKDLHRQAQRLRMENKNLEQQTKVLESWVQVQAKSLLSPNVYGTTTHPKKRASQWTVIFTALGGLFVLLIPLITYKPRLAKKQIRILKHGLKISLPEKCSLRDVHPTVKNP